MMRRCAAGMAARSAAAPPRRSSPAAHRLLHWRRGAHITPCPPFPIPTASNPAQRPSPSNAPAHTPTQMPTANRRRFVRQRAREGFEAARGARGADADERLRLGEAMLESAAVQRRLLNGLAGTGNLKGPRE